MNRFKMLVLVGAAGVALAGPAKAQFFGQMGPLEGMSSGHTLFGAYIGLADGSVGPMAEFRASSGKHATAGIAASVEHSVFGLQVDARGGLTGTGGEYPLELGGQLAAGLLTGGGSTGIYAQAVPGLSFEWDAGEGRSFSTWAGLGLRITAASHNSGGSNGMIRVGTRYNFSPSVGFSAALEDVGGSSRFLAGVGYTY